MFQIMNRRMLVSSFRENVVTKPQRDTESQSRLRGYNHNFKYQGKTFHIQTENYGYPRCYICSHVFISGRVVKRIKTEYPKTTDELQSLAHLKGLMLAAHRQMFQLLKSGEFDAYIDLEPDRSPPAPEASDSPTFGNSDIEKLDEQLKNAADAFKDAPPVTRPPSVPLPAANGPAIVHNAPQPKNGLSPAIPRPIPEPTATRLKPALNVTPSRNAAKPKPLTPTPKKKAATPAAPTPSKAKQKSAPRKTKQKSARVDAALIPKKEQLSVPRKAIPTPPKKNALPSREPAKPKTTPKPAPANAPTLSTASQANLAEFTKAISGLVTLALFDASDERGHLQFASGPSAKVSPPVLKGLVKLRQSDRNPKDPTDHMLELVTNAEHHLMLLCRVTENSSLFLLIERSKGNLALVHHRVSKLIPKLQRDLIKA